MEVQAPRRQLEREQKTMSGLQASGAQSKRNICSFWLAGRCNRNPCRFLHSRMPLSQISEPKQSHHLPHGHQTFPNSRTWQREADSLSGSCSTTLTQPPSKTSKSLKKKSICTASTQPPFKTDVSQKRKRICRSPTLSTTKNDASLTKHCIFESPTQLPTKIDESHINNNICESSNTVCKDWIDGNCIQGDMCGFFHTWSFGKGFSLVTKLEGHKNAITGIAVCSISNKLVTVGKDKTMRIWDCNNGQCLSVDNFEDEVDCMAAKGSFIFVGMQNTIKGWDSQNHLSINLSGSSDKVNTVVVEGDKIFAGTENGSILVWKANASGYPEISEPLRGHIDAVVCLRIGSGGSRMFSGSRDNTIKEWDLNTMECIETLYGHTSTVTSLLCWETYLFSGSLDQTIKAWAFNKNGNLEVVYTHEEGHGVITLDNIYIYDPEKKPILLVSCDDSCVRLRELPSFEERGRLFSKKEVCAIETIELEDSQIFFFTGDASVGSYWEKNSMTHLMFARRVLVQRVIAERKKVASINKSLLNSGSADVTPG